MKAKRKKRGAPPKPLEQAKGDVKQIRLNAAELDAFRDAAELAGISVSAWMRERLRVVARDELQAAGRAVPFLENG